MFDLTTESAKPDLTTNDAFDLAIVDTELGLESEATDDTNPNTTAALVATIEDDNEHDMAVVPEGLPILGDEKMSAYPEQDDVIRTNHHFIRSRATGDWGTFEAPLLNYNEIYNRDFFFSSLPALEIKIGACSSPRTVLGQYANRGDHGIVGEITINERLYRNAVKGILIEDTTKSGFMRYVNDILLHEMVHAYCHIVLANPEDTYRGHGPIFTRECNRIGETLGLAPVKHSKSRKRSEDHLQRCNQWPHCVRDPSYYEGAIIDVIEASPEVDTKKLTSLLDPNAIGPGEMFRRLFYLATKTKNTRRGRERLASALIGGMRLMLGETKRLSQFPADMLPPDEVPDPSVA